MATTTEPRARLLTEREVAQRLGLKNPRTLSVWRCTNRYPALRWLKVGRLIRYRAEDVEAFIEEQMND